MRENRNRQSIQKRFDRRRQEPPLVMTWKKASFFLVVCVVFDALRLFFTMFWFFGPALAGMYCTSKAGALVGQWWGLTAFACTAAGGIIGYFSAPVTVVFGTVMAIAVGLFGWMTVGLLLLMFNSRIFKENALWFISSLAISEIPLVGALPSMTAATWKMFSNQIKKERAAFKKYEKEQSDEQLREAQYLAQVRAHEQMQAENNAQIDEQEITDEEEMMVVEKERVAEEGEGPPEENEIQFETLKDALSELNNKQNRTQEENRKLVRAKEIMKKISITTGGDTGDERNDPVLFAAYNRARLGQKIWDNTDATRNGFKFNVE
jgi:hypothetical protein